MKLLKVLAVVIILTGGCDFNTHQPPIDIDERNPLINDRPFTNFIPMIDTTELQGISSSTVSLSDQLDCILTNNTERN